MKTLSDIFYTPDKKASQSLDVYLPEGCESFPTFVYFHGGGIVKGSKVGKTAEAIAEYLTAHGIALVSANYRLYPHAHYPDFIYDAAAAVAWAVKNMPEYGASDKVFVGGSSAGGYLSMMLCFDKKYLGLHGIDPAKLAGFIHDACQPTAHFNVLKERGVDPRRVIIDESAPLFHIGTAPEYAPMLFIVSDNDMKNRFEQTQLVLSTLKHFAYDPSKIEYRLMNGKHCAYDAQIDEDGQSVFGKIIADFILNRFSS